MGTLWGSGDGDGGNLIWWIGTPAGAVGAGPGAVVGRGGAEEIEDGQAHAVVTTSTSERDVPL